MNIIICGIGGQGVLFATNILATTFFKSGKKACFAKIFDEGQRNGSVSTHLRIEKGESPLIPVGKADLIASLDKEETERNSHYLSKEGQLVEVYGKSNMFLLGRILKKINLPQNLLEEQIKQLPNAEANLEEFRKGVQNA